MVDWPEGIPFFKLRSGYGAQPGENTLRTPMDVGPEKVRRRTTAAPSVITGSAYMTREQAMRFEEFWRDTLKDGALSFTLTDGLYRRRNLLVQSEDFSAGWNIAGTGNPELSVFGSEQRITWHSGVGSVIQLPGFNPAAGETWSLFFRAKVVDLGGSAASDFQLSIRHGDGSNAKNETVTLNDDGLFYDYQMSQTFSSTSVSGSYAHFRHTGTGSPIIALMRAQLETAPAFTQYEPVGASYPATHVTRGGGKTYRIVGVPQFAPMGIGHRVSVSLEVLP